MSRKLNKASALAVAATLMTLVISADGSGAAAQAVKPGAAIQEPTPEASTLITTPQVPAVVTEGTVPETETAVESLPVPAPRAASLAALVAAQPFAADLSRELNCLAGAIYFEAKSETLAGQLAVGRVIVARSKSGRFPDSYCGVVFQRSQFSFVRGGAMPRIDRGSAAWHRASAIARIAHEGLWDSQAGDALYFHARYVHPSWSRTKIARATIDSHIFYR